MKSFKPTTPGRRGTKGINYRNVLTRSKPEKSLTKGIRRTAGRNSQGRITVRHKGGGHKRRFRDIDFLYNKKGVPATIESVEYDPNRSGFIGLALYKDGERRYVLLPQGVNVGSTFLVAEDATIKVGNRTVLACIPVGSFVYNVELKRDGGAKLARSAGNYAQVVAQDAGHTHLKMPSSEVRKVSSGGWASIGEVSNGEHRLKVIGKAGRSRWLGKRPTVRGMAMNPVDHPMGGGEARGRGRRKRRKTPWGKIAYGVKTRRPKKYSNTLVLRRRKTGKKRT